MTSTIALWLGALLALRGPVTEVAITPFAEQTSVFIAVDGSVDYRDFVMEGPHRLVLDLSGARYALPQREWTDIRRGGIHSLRASQYSDDVVRVVLVLERKLGYTILPEDGGLRVVMENPAGAFAPWSSRPGGAFDPTALVPAHLAAARQQVPPQEVPAQAQPQETQQAAQAQDSIPRINVRWSGASIDEVLLAFSEYSGKSIVKGSDVDATVTANIENQRWDDALEAILTSLGLDATETDEGIIRVDQFQALSERELIEPILTRPYQVRYGTAAEVQTQLQPLVTPNRGQITTAASTNTIIVSDIARVHTAVEQLLSSLDRPIPQVQIQAKIIFVNRTALDELGVRYELKDSRGNQINALSSGGADFDGNGVIDLDEAVPQGQAIVLLGGSSIAAIGNASQAVGSPTMQLLASLALGRHQLISFIDALSTVNLSDIQAEPSITTLDNQQARIHVGEITPIRIIDAGTGGAAAGATFPTAQVEEQETGIILQATPHVTGNQILLELIAERSAAELASSDVGFIFNTQRAETRVIVQDGETAVIGGLTQTEVTEARSGIPVLMDLPLLGRLFRVTRHNEVQRDLIILVTPHIVRPLN